MYTERTRNSTLSLSVVQQWKWREDCSAELREGRGECFCGEGVVYRIWRSTLVLVWCFIRSYVV